MAVTKEKTFFPYAKQSITDADIEAVSKALKADIITRGAKLEAFEAAIQDYCACQYAVAFTNGTSALHAACFAAKASRHDRLVTSPNTFIATVGCGYRFGVQPVFIDIDRKTGNLDLEKLKFNTEYRSTRGKSIYIPVHFSGIPINMQKFASLIKEPDAVIIEDAAHAFGSSYLDKSKVGSCTYSDMTIFSFHPAKNITTAEGGCVTTNNKAFYERLLLFRNNGIVKGFDESYGPWYYEVQEISGNYFMNELQAALGLSQLKRVNAFVKKRRKLINAYRKHLADEANLCLFEPEDEENVAYHLSVLQIDFSSYGKDRASVMRELKEENIGTQVHYIPIYRHPFFTKGKKDISAYFPEMEAYYSQALTLPLYPDLTERDVAKITKTLLKILKK